MKVTIEQLRQVIKEEISKRRLVESAGFEWFQPRKGGKAKLGDIEVTIKYFGNAYYRKGAKPRALVVLPDGKEEWVTGDVLAPTDSEVKGYEALARINAEKRREFEELIAKKAGDGST